MKTIKQLLLGLLFGAGAATTQIPAHAEDKWAVATATDNGKPLIFRYIMSPPEGIKIANYPNLVAISWVYDSTIRNGMPEPKINQRMVQLEELLDKKLEGSRNAYLTVSVTGNGRKEWQWYSRDVSETMRLINEALSGQQVFPIEISRQSDPTWSAYFRIAKAAK